MNTETTMPSKQADAGFTRHPLSCQYAAIRQNIGGTAATGQFGCTREWNESQCPKIPAHSCKREK